MPNLKDSRPLGDSNEVQRRKQNAQLFAPHVAPLNRLVEKIRSHPNGEANVPWFDPSGAGINAKVLFLLQDPSPTAIIDTGFISPDNPDVTARNITVFRDNANLHSTECVHWNIIPWAKNERDANQEISRAKPFLSLFISLLTHLRVVICMGVPAANGWDLAYPSNPCITGWKVIDQKYDLFMPYVLKCPSPSGQSLHGYHPLLDGLTPKERIEKTFSNARMILDKCS